MQSGIAVSSELHDAFNTFTADSSLFCLPITITSESLTPLPAIPFSSPNAFYASLPQLSSVLQPKTPLYLIFRRPESEGSSSSTLAALTYIPSNAGVRAKTLFASTRATFVRELGSEKFSETIFATDEDEVIGEAAWKERDAEKSGKSNGGNGRFRREDLMDDKERELEAVRRAEEEARHGTTGRDVGIGGSLAASGPSTGGMNVKMPVDDEAKAALKGLQQGGMVQLAIDIPTETIKLAESDSSVSPASLSGRLSESSPRYTLYHYPDSDAVIFIYTCPSNSSIKERMLYASTRRVAIDIAEAEGLNVAKKIEGSSPDEITEARLHEEVHPPQDDGPKRGFARPRRPGR
ncbi:actin monomer binding protein [Paecilomyces variotii No. 5]|uniref:Twinfilin n=1 Tax=Byssochlamys spectabilis (strain No. 5 / NBRC 109023) TaxID=1356009 RepID=V5FQA2_BYSSN|nr:actin monomer binding protein [Paecilomyces variotii No. 5]